MTQINKEKTILVSEEDISLLFAIGLAAPQLVDLPTHAISSNFALVMHHCFSEAIHREIINVDALGDSNVG